MTLNFIDTHAHLDGEEFRDDLDAVVARAREAGVAKVFVPTVDLKSVDSVLSVARRYPGFAYPMIGLHPEEVRSDWQDVLTAMAGIYARTTDTPFIAVGEVGLDYYWSREFEAEQLAAFEQQVQWSIAWQVPLMIHCRKAQNEMVRLLSHYRDELPGGVFHCFTGNEHEAAELLQFPRFVLGIGGVLTFKKSNLPQVLPAVVPLSRIVLETDAPYMAPVPHRGQRNESAYVLNVLQRLAQCYGVDSQTVARQTTENVSRLFTSISVGMGEL